MTGWLFQPGFRFGAGGPTLESLLFAQAAAGVDVRVILWASRVLLETRSPGGSIAEASRRVTEMNVEAAERLGFPDRVLRGAPAGRASPARLVR